MCFSATASFATAGVLFAAGFAALARAEGARSWPLAATPLLFAVQQCVEGTLWLTLPAAPESAAASGLTLLYLLFAEILWPVYAPLAVLLIEPSPRRRQCMAACLAVGIAVAIYLLWLILATPRGALIVEGHVVYVAGGAGSDAVGALYLAATVLALLVASNRTIVALGAVVLAGAAVAYVFYRVSFVSVWCLFAAAASGVIVFHFRRESRRAGRVARA